jgi:hypothetical protein
MLPVFALTFLIAAAAPSTGSPIVAAAAASPTPFPFVTPAALPGAPTPNPLAVATQTPLVNSFDGVTLGDTRADATKSLGRPSQVVPVNVGEMWTWNTDGGHAVLAIVFANDSALSVTLSPNGTKKSALQDPYGVSLGMTVDQVTSLRGQPVTVADNGNRVYGNLAGVRWVYGFDSGVLTDIDLTQPVQSLATPTPALLDSSGGRNGSTMLKAVIVKAASSSAGLDLEYSYIKGLTCGQGSSWNIVTQTTVAAGEKWYDEFDVVCASDKSTDVIYFDVSAFAGK